MSVGIVNTIRKHKKIAGLALPVLVALGAIWPAHKSSAENIFQSIQANIVVSGDLVVSPSASNITLPSNLFTVEWVGIPEGGGNPVRVQVGVDRVRAGGPNTLAQRIASVRIGLIDASQDIKSVNCPPTYGCDFPVETSSLNNNPVDAGAFGSFAPADLEQNRTGTKTYKIVPVYSTALPHLLDGGNASTFTITWDPNVAAAQAQNRSAPTNVTTGAGTLGTIPDVCPPGYRIQLTGGVYGGGNPTCVEDKSLIGALELVTNIILTVILGVVRAVLHFLFGIVLIPILEALLSPSGNFMAAQIPSVVQEMWIYVRDIMNLLFILVLIFAGIATMLRLEGYGLRRTITRVIIIALVVNFSLLIGQIVLNFAQIVMNEFIGPGTLEQVRSGVDIFGDTGRMREFWTINAAEGTRNTAMLLFAIVYEIGMFFVLAAFGALLLIRLVGVWLLLVIAPIAYVLYITEFGKKFFGQWWHRFLSYAFFAPIVAFFIALAAKFVASPTFMSLPPPQGASASQGIGSAIVAAMQGVMVLAILVFGLNIARKMGIAGADMVVGQAQKLWKGAAKGSMTFIPRAIGGAAKAGGGALSRYGAKFGDQSLRGMGLRALGGGIRGVGGGFKQFGTAPATTKAFYGSMAATAKANLARDARMSAASMESALAKTPIIGAAFRGLGGKQEAKESAIRAQIAEKLKDIHSDSAEDLTAGFKREVAAGKGYEAVAYMSKLAANGDLNELTNAFGKTNDAYGLQAVIEEQLVPLIGKESAYALGHDVSMMAENANHYNYGRAFRAVDKGGGKFEYQKNENALADAFKQYIKKEPQKIATAASRHGWGFVEAKNEKGETMDYGWSPEGREFFRALPANNQLSSRLPYQVLGTGMLKNTYTAFLDNKELALQFADRMAGLDENQLRALKASVTPSVDGDDLDQLQQFDMETIHALLTGRDTEGKLIERNVKILQPKVDREKGTVTVTHEEQPFQKLLNPDDLKRAPQLRKAYTDWHLEKFGVRPDFVSEVPALSTEAAQSIAHELDLKRDVINELEGAARVLHTGAQDLNRAINNLTSSLSTKKISLDASTIDKIKSELVNKTVQAKITGADRAFASLASVPGLRLRVEKVAADELDAQLSKGDVKLGDPRLTEVLAKRLEPVLKDIPKAAEVAKALAQAINKKEKPNKSEV